MANRANSDTKFIEYTNFLEYLNLIGSDSITMEELDELYEEYIEIEFNHHKVSIPFDSVVYHELLNLITTIIKEY